MRIHRSDKLCLQGAVIAIGAFDGVHKGHQKVIQQTVELGKSLGVPSVIYTFDQPPRAYFQGAQVLSDPEEKMSKLSKMGVDHTIVATFNDEYLQRTAQSFIEELALMNPHHVIVGEDFKFGYKRSGDINLLRKYFNVNTISPVCCKKGERISSTRIRELMIEGKQDQTIPLFI